MFHLVVTEVNRLRFSSWFRKNPQDRNLFLSAYSQFLHSHGCCTGFIFEVPSLSVMAERIFDDMLKWYIHSICLYPQSEEVCICFQPFTFNRSGAEPLYKRNDRKQFCFLNPS